MEGGYFYLDWFFLDGCFATSYAHWSYPNRIAPFGRILFAVALLNALRISSDFILASPFHTGLTQSPLKTSVPDVFAFSCSSIPKSTRFARLFIRLICILKQASNPASSHKLLLRRALVASSHKKAHAVRVGFVTPSGFKPETF